MKLIHDLQAAGYCLKLDGEKVVAVWTKTEDPDPAKVSPLIEELRRRKESVREYLRGLPGACESCPAAGHWDGYGRSNMPPGRYCFFEACFKGKTARPVMCDERRPKCPKLDDGNPNRERRK